jgi:hypothetical protein
LRDQVEEIWFGTKYKHNLKLSEYQASLVNMVFLTDYFVNDQVQNQSLGQRRKKQRKIRNSEEEPSIFLQHNWLLC